MDQLKEMIQRRLDEKIASGGRAALQAVRDLQAQHGSTRDYLVESRDHVHMFHEHQDGMPGNVKMLMQDGREEVNWPEFTLHPNAIGQLAARMGIPGAYLRELAEGDRWQRNLAATITRRHIAEKPNQRWLLRAVNGELRGLLSSSYRRMDSAPIFSQFAQTAYDSKAVLWNGTCGDVRGYLEVVIPEVHEIETPNNGKVYIAFGASISSSDFGQGSLDVRSFFVQGICANGAIRHSLLKRVHLGKRLDHEDFQFKTDTYAADTRAMQLAVRDVATSALSPEQIEKEKQAIIRASSRIISDPEKHIKALPRLGLLASEIELMEKLLLKGDPNDGIQGEFTQWKLQQTVTAMARELEPVRMREVQMIAGNMMD